MSEERRVIVYPNDATGSGLYRLTWPAKAVAANGKPVVVMPRAPQIVVDNNNQIRGISVGNYNTVVFQRPGSVQFSKVIPLLQEQGVRVIVDIDDSFSTIHPRNVAFKYYDPRVSHDRNWMHIARACELADLVTVTTQALAEEYGSHGRVAVLPNCIPESYLQIPRPYNEVPVVGWAGWTNTHCDDLYGTKGTINQVLVETGAKFAAFGDEKIFQDLQIRRKPPHEYWGFTEINQYPHKLVGFDIGLVPLKKGPFNNCKSALKLLEYSSLGIVAVVSPTPDNMRLVEQGMGVVARTPREWYDRVKEFVLDTDYRLEMSKKVRDIAANFTIEGNWEQWWNTWSGTAA